MGALKPLHETLKEKRWLKSAHRGGRATAPENTLTAFRKALEAGVDMIELDVQLTRDGHPVVFHDWTLERTTNGRGRVADQSLADLRRLDAGSWFGDGYRGEPVPTLSEVLEWSSSRLYLQIELKSRGDDEEVLCDRVVRMIKERHMEEQVMVMSFDHAIARRVKQLEPRMMTGVICQARLIDPVLVVRQAQADVLCVDYDHLRREDVDTLHRQNVAVQSFAPTPDTLRELVEWGVDIVQTDDPSAFQAVTQQE